jgi:hypothetical protein
MLPLRLSLLSSGVKLDRFLLTSGLHYNSPLNGILRNHDIADRHFLSEARTTKTPRVTDAGRTTNQIIARQNSNKAG